MLPSETSALVLLEQGWRAAFPGIAANVLERASLIAIGLSLVQVKPIGRVVLGALAGALVVEVGVIDYVRRHQAPPTIESDYADLAARALPALARLAI